MNNYIHHGCCLEYMKTLKTNSVDCIITSPPYNMNLRISGKKYISRQILKSEFTTKYNSFTDNMPIEEFYQFHKSVLKECLRISPLVFYNISIVTGSKRAFFKLIGHFNEQLKDILYWNKTRAQPSMAEGVMNRQAEMFLILSKETGISRQFKDCIFQRGTFSDLINCPPTRIKNHGATMPLEIVNIIIKNFVGPNKKIFDPFMGSGTTAIASLQNNCEYGGCEIDPVYIKLQQERLKNIQLQLF